MTTPHDISQSASRPAPQPAPQNTLQNAPAPLPSRLDYLRQVLTSRVYDVAVESALDEAPALSRRTGHTVLLKREDQQPVFSFKLRGAYNKMAHLTPGQLHKGVICASAGNHAQGVALGARKLGARAVIVMPVTTPRVKVDAVRALGGEVVLAGESYSDAYAHSLQLQAQQGLTFIHPFDDPLVIAGQGTIGMELLRQHAGPLHAVFVAVGGGGLISGVAAYIKALRPEIKIIGVQMNDSDAMAQSVARGERVALRDVGLFADGTAVKQVGEETFRIARELVDEFITVDTDAVCAAIKDVFIDTRSIVEPSGAMAVAALKQYAAREGTAPGQTLAAILCGANMNFDRLRFVAERAAVGEESEALFAITIPEERGSFRRFCETVGRLPGGARNVTEFNYRISDRARAPRAANRPCWPPPSSRRAFRRWTSPTTSWPSNTCATWWAATRRWPATSGCCALSSRSAPARCCNFSASCSRPGTSACFTTATRAPISATCSWASRRPKATARPCTPFWTSWATPGLTKPATRPTRCFSRAERLFNRRAARRRSPAAHTKR